MFAREPFSGAAKAGVNFIENQKRAMFVAKFSEQGQKFWRRNVTAAACLNRFDENCANSVRAGKNGGLEILRWQDRKFLPETKQNVQIREVAIEMDCENNRDE